MNLAPQEISLDVLREKYCKGEESTVDDVRRRVARALAAVEHSPETWEPVFYDAQSRGVVMAGRINSAAGTELCATLINCFVQPVGDSISGTDAANYPGIFIALREAAETMRRGGGVGYDFSRIRPKGSVVLSTRSEASGPVSYMRIFDSSCATVQSAGSRRGAQMGILRVDHPDVEEFIRSKYEERALSNFNLSLAVPDAFMRAVEADEDFELVHAVPPSARFAGQQRIERRADGLYVYQRIRARDLWDRVMRSTYDHGEPGVVFIDRIHEENNLHYCERIEATNPCAEEPLPPYGCCCLGSINLAALISDPFT
ncbi:MAG: ribonucleotide reductase N-terminal alpha domain-containing protein, partial [Steroidobacteraceae bacterium]